MNAKLNTLLVAILLPFSTLGNQLLDNFNDGILDTDAWNVYLPTWDGNQYPAIVGGRLEERDNYLHFYDGAILTTVDNFPQATIEGTFQFSQETWSYDQFRVFFRANGSLDSHWQVPNSGLYLQFTMNSNPDYPNNGEIQLWDANNAIWSDEIGRLAEASYQIDINTPYDFRIVDDGYNVSVYMDDINVPLLTYSTSIDDGDLIQFSNREFLLVPNFVDELRSWSLPHMNTYFAAMDSVVIHSPEPSALAFLLTGGLWLVWLKKMN